LFGRAIGQGNVGVAPEFFGYESSESTGWKYSNTEVDATSSPGGRYRLRNEVLQTLSSSRNHTVSEHVQYFSNDLNCGGNRSRIKPLEGHSRSEKNLLARFF